MKKLSISNRRLLLGSIFGFVGALTIAADKFPPVHHYVDQHPPWNDITNAVQDLKNYDFRQPDGQMVGVLSGGDRGFEALVEIIKINRPDIREKIVAIAQNSPMKLGGQPSSIIHVVHVNQKDGTSVTTSLTTDFIFQEWITKHRERYFLKRGLVFVTLAFLLGIIGRIEVRPAKQ